MTGLLLLAGSLLYEGTISVRALEWRAVPLKVSAFPIEVECAFTVLRGSTVRGLVLTYRDLQLMRDRERHTLITSTSFVRSGAFVARLEKPESYYFVVDNSFDGRGPAQVAIRLIQRPTQAAVQPVYASPARRRAAIILSLCFWFGAAGFTIWRIRRAHQSDTFDAEA